MEAAAHTVSRFVPCLSGTGADARSLKSCPGIYSFRHPRSVSFKAISNDSAVLSSGFSNSAHEQYYLKPLGCGGKGNKEIKTAKKKTKLIKRLSKDLNLFSNMEFGEEAKGEMISEAAEFLMTELQRVRTEQKEQKKRMKKEQKAQRKVNCKSVASSSSSSPSSESSERDCEAIINLRHLRNNTTTTTLNPEAVKMITQDSTTLAIQEECKESLLRCLETNRIDGCVGLIGSNECGTSKSSGMNKEALAQQQQKKKIEVCMGGKCKKMGSVALLDELERKIGVEGAVVGCKCMGKCKSAPNVRVSNTTVIENLDVDHGSLRSSTNPLFIGVGLKDVDMIVADFNDSHFLVPY